MGERGGGQLGRGGARARARARTRGAAGAGAGISQCGWAWEEGPGDLISHGPHHGPVHQPWSECSAPGTTPQPGSEQLLLLPQRSPARGLAAGGQCFMSAGQGKVERPPLQEVAPSFGAGMLWWGQSRCLCCPQAFKWVSCS